ncbi:MAG: hypothetical protein PUA56_05680 [Bacillales bacterium]|nr:hypothetical protein [Bacillales bacterium]
MEDKSKYIFGNKIDNKTYKKALKSKAKFIKKFSDDSNVTYHFKTEPIKEIDELGIKNLVIGDQKCEFDSRGVVIGNIRMGFGHYRISLAICSCAKALGYVPYWFDVSSFKESTGSKFIKSQNDLYSLGSKLSQRSILFNKYWEYLNSEGFKKLTYNACDQKNTELLTPLYQEFPKDIPFIATHVWPSQGAVHASLTHVVNAIPDNWPMALHLSEGAIHTVQTPYAYLGYKSLNGFDKKRTLKGIPDNELFQVGHYIDHELVSNVEKDCQERINRINNKQPLRILLTVGGAGAGEKMYLETLNHLLPLVKKGKVIVFINFGDHLKVWNYIKKHIPSIEENSTLLFNEYSKLKEIISNDDFKGIYAIYNENIFEAVYSTNLLMRKSDILITKPSELSFYPIPKIFNKHIGGHEKYGAYYAQEIGDSTYECKTKKELNNMIDLLINDSRILIELNNRIIALKKTHYYDGGYEVVKLAVKGK